MRLVHILLVVVAISCGPLEAEADAQRSRSGDVSGLESLISLLKQKVRQRQQAQGIRKEEQPDVDDLDGGNADDEEKETDDKDEAEDRTESPDQDKDVPPDESDEGSKNGKTTIWQCSA